MDERKRVSVTAVAAAVSRAKARLRSDFRMLHLALRGRDCPDLPPEVRDWQCDAPFRPR
ncbi:hypothetical protein GCM10017567_74020 [Amycolatopsis bullii]|uniref:Uncharacterized protein n=1 Tax=Amycolatopsis bullii TaxID=941987 RepID=A0ABQ3KPR2_9PSEU|nr:hypothetical protein GCM10017567_74020 [Amycolatopsis bullii]